MAIGVIDGLAGHSCDGHIGVLQKSATVSAHTHTMPDFRICLGKGKGRGRAVFCLAIFCVFFFDRHFLGSAEPTQGQKARAKNRARALVYPFFFFY